MMKRKDEEAKSGMAVLLCIIIFQFGYTLYFNESI